MRHVQLNRKETYEGKAVKPKVTVIDNLTDKALPTSNYTIGYENNIETSDDNPIITITGKGNCTGTITKHFRIYANDISKCVFGKIENMPYTGRLSLLMW